MAFTTETRRWHWFQIALMMALGALAAVSAAWGKFGDTNEDSSRDQINSVAPQNGKQAARVWPQKSILEIDVNPHDPSEKKPPDKSAAIIDSAPNLHWFNSPHPSQTVFWKAPNIQYQQLYFEDAALERYGQTPWGNLDVARTGVLFFGDLLALPHNANRRNPNSCDTPLGFSRPGSPAPATSHYLFYRQ